MFRIYNVHEKQVYNILKKYVKRERYLYKKPTEQLNTFRRIYDSFIVYQTPFTDLIGYTQWTDFSLLCKDKNIDLRIEVKSLKPSDSKLRNVIYELLRDSRYMPEKKLVLVLLGDGFNDKLLVDVNYLISTEKYPIIIFREIESFKTYIDSLFK